MNSDREPSRPATHTRPSGLSKAARRFSAGYRSGGRLGTRSFEIIEVRYI